METLSKDDDGNKLLKDLTGTDNGANDARHGTHGYSFESCICYTHVELYSYSRILHVMLSCSDMHVQLCALQVG